MTITATIVADSICTRGHRLTTMVVRYPRFIHAEFMTHRVFSRNASSSRAVPVEKMIAEIENDCAKPVAWGSNKPGMQAGENLEAQVEAFCKMVWNTASKDAVRHAWQLVAAGAHKQIVNRLLEPFAHITVIVSATEWANFFALRCHPDAEPTMQATAVAMRAAMDASTPRALDFGQWHLPYIKEEVWDISVRPREENAVWRALAKISAARCARVSYLNHDGTQPNIDKDLALAERLATSRHMSPFEHQARATGDDGTALWGNFVGWDQYRKMIE